MTTRDWMNQGTTLFLGTLDQVSDEHLEAETSLPGWTGRHLVAHVHFNALALRRLVSWAATGVENRMYHSPEQRNDEIEQGARLPIPELRDLVRNSATELADALDALSPAARQAQVVTAQGRTVPVDEVAWMRSREMFIHAVDLGSEATFADFPDEVIGALLVDVVGRRSGNGQGANLAAWLTGRTPVAPILGRWL
jgi:maleylpyruvate isomerase